ncbi:hypothetical protein HB791_04820 [Listeria welshimeri]|uniref:hypothetical protein n=1 Tax=Listeria welshimeri TaxID=1643 RepID=UPI00162502B3|nr:hypothetical protein [Listeria welshimeri]MBC1498498.1 hypothetical protein [Listeria welshimeri]MBC1635271.1 hypothetical protein [Listeria welshimeri]MBC2347528.1 hypothetical protein [Listeria welshimeri]MBC6174516.1 hypothetical protein [Listeria welshimeri]MBC6178121.1 hypothetical protein [Listeria welshimeri]
MVLAIVLLGVSPTVVEAEVIDVPVTVSAGGGELNLTKKEIKEELAYQKQLVEELKSANDNKEKIVKEYLADNENAIANKIGNSEDSPEFIDTYIINDETQLIFTDTEVMLDTTEMSNENEATSEEEKLLREEDSNESIVSSIKDFGETVFFGKKVYAASSKTVSARHTRTVYAKVSGNKLFTAGIGAKFTYNGAKVTAQTTENYVKVNGISGVVWSVHDKKNGVQKPSIKKRVVYQQATAKSGLTIKGNGLVVEETYIRVNLECNHLGKVSKSSVVR